jgi:hypothetical protein
LQALSVVLESYALAVPSKNRRIASIADPEKAGRRRRRTAEALLDAMEGDQFDLNLAAIDRLNASPKSRCRSSVSGPS